MTDIVARRAPSKTFLRSAFEAKHHFAVFAVVVLVALIYQFGYPLVIALGLIATFAAIAMLVGLTALDVIGQSKPAPRARAARRLAIQPA